MAQNRTDPEEFLRFDHILRASIPDYEPFFFKLVKNGKDPWAPKGEKDYSWKTGKLTTNEAVEAMREGYNIGIAGTDTDQLAIIDRDDPKAFAGSDYGKSLVVRSGGRIGDHVYNFTKDPKAKINISLDEIGEIRSNWQYVVCPGSFATVTGKADIYGRIIKTYDERMEEIPEDDRGNAGKYEIIEDNPVREITYDDYPDMFKTAAESRAKEDKEIEQRKLERSKKEYVKSDGKKSGFYDIELSDVINHVPDRKRFPSLFHDSSTGTNAAMSNDGKLIHCWRDGCSHNGIQAMAVISGMYTCVDAGVAHRGSGAGRSKVDLQDGKTVYDLWIYAKKQGILPQDGPIPAVAAKWFALDKGYCKESDIREGWRVPGHVYIRVIKEHGLFEERQIEVNDSNATETNTNEIISEDDYKKEIAQITDNKFELGIPTNHFIAKYVEWAKTTTDAYSEYHIVSALWLLAVSTGGKVYVPLASDRVYANLWIQINGPSTIARKTVAVNKAKRIHETVVGDVLLNPDFSRDGLLRELHENPIMPSIRDESSSLLSKMHQKYNDGIFALECQLYDRQSIKKSLAKAEDSIVVIHPYICRIYASTPEVYTKVMKIEDFECGWGYRWLHVYPRYKRERRPLRLETDNDVDMWATVLSHTKKQFNFFNNRAEFPMGISNDAMKMYQDITMGLENYAVERNNSYFNGMIGRGNDHIMKIAMLYELGKNEISLEIQVDSIIFATRFVIYSIECELGLINDLLENVEINKVEKVLHAIKKSNGSIGHSKLLQNVRMYKEDIQKCIEVLVEAELIEVVKVKSDKGKVATYYRLLVNEEDKIDFKNVFQNSDIFGFHDLDGIDIGKFVKLDKLDKLDQLDKVEMGKDITSNLSNSINLDSKNDNNAMDPLHVRRSTTTLPYETSNLSNLSNSTKPGISDKSQYDYGQKTMKLLDEWYGNTRPDNPSESKSYAVHELVRITGMSHESALKHVMEAFKVRGWA